MLVLGTVLRLIVEANALLLRVISPVTYNWAVQTFLGAKRMECVQLAGAFVKGRRSESASKLDALHTLRDNSALQQCSGVDILRVMKPLDFARLDRPKQFITMVEQ